jgi:hypothetical protein
MMTSRLNIDLVSLLLVSFLEGTENTDNFIVVSVYRSALSRDGMLARNQDFCPMYGLIAVRVQFNNPE